MGVSIVIPAYNAERFLAATVASVRAQTFQDWEIVIVNDGSTDSTLEIGKALSHDDSRIRVVDQPNSGPSLTRNRGLQECAPKHSFVLFLDADDLLTERALELLTEHLSNRPHMVAAHGVHRFFRTEGELLPDAEQPSVQRMTMRDKRRVPLLPSEAAGPECLALNNFIATGAVMIRKRVFETIRPFDPTLWTMEDWHLWYRIAKIHPIGRVDAVTLLVRLHGNSLSVNRKRMREGRRQMFRSLMRDADRGERKMLRRAEFVQACFYSGSSLHHAGAYARRLDVRGFVRELPVCAYTVARWVTTGMKCMLPG